MDHLLERLLRLARPLGIALGVAATSAAMIAGHSSTSGAAAKEVFPPQAGEYHVKAGFLYNFALYVRWPDEAFESPESPVVFAVLGRDPFGEILDEVLADKRVHERPIAVRRFRRTRDITPCHVLFVPRGELEQLPRTLEILARAPVVLVGESDGFATRGGVINFYIEESRVRFEVNPDVARTRDLRVSSKLLRLARVVSGQGPG